MIFKRLLLLFGCICLLPGCWNQAPQKSPPDPPSTSSPEKAVSKESDSGTGESEAKPAFQPEAKQSIDLLEQDSLDGWETANFGGERECTVESGVLNIEAGYPLNGVVTTREDLPVDQFEISLEAKRVEGVDFFCGLTFPVGEGHCTFIVGGWAGAIVGLSCIDGKDAARNETKTLMNFEDDQWYRIKIRVDSHVTAWIDDQQVAYVARAGKEFTLRNETLVTRPYGLCTFETTAQYRNIKLTKLSPTK